MKVIVGIVSRGNDINYRLAQFLYRLRLDTSNVYLEPFMSKSPYSLQVGQEFLFKTLEGMDFDYAFITDTDVACEQWVINKLLEVGKDVVVGPVWQCDANTSDIHLNVRKKGRVDVTYYPRKDGVEQIDAASFSCMLVSKRVFNAFRDNGESYFVDAAMNINPLQTDEIFFRKLKKLGIEAWIRWDIETVHYKVVDLSTKVIDRFISETLEYRGWDGRQE